MKVTLESTSTVQTIMRGPHTAIARLWEGTTEDGVPVKAYIAVISPQTHDAAANAKFATAFEEVTRDSRPAAIDMRFIL